jgi:hypothetical protein
MRGLLPLARLARSMVRASSMSATVSRISRNKAFARESCLLSCAQLPGRLVAVEVALLINVFPVAHIIHHQAGAFQLKEHAVVAGAQAILVLEALELLDVAGQVVLGTVKLRADQATDVLGQGREAARGPSR